MSGKGQWKYRLGLLLILAVTLIWVTSAEVTQVRCTLFALNFCASVLSR